MPIMFIEESSPMKLRVERDNGDLIGEMTIPVSGKNCEWEITHGRGQGVNKSFEMAPKGGGPGQELRIEFH